MSDRDQIGLENLRPPPGAKKRKQRVGRGAGSGRGKTSGRGHKGQKARSGARIPAWFEGGQMPLYRRLPKRGFTPPNRVENEIVNVGDLERIEASEIGPEELEEGGLIGRLDRPVKILGDGAVERALSVRAHAFSRSAREKIEAAGGDVELIE